MQVTDNITCIYMSVQFNVSNYHVELVVCFCVFTLRAMKEG